MLRKITVRMMAALLALAPVPALAQSNPVVVELYTSQGCSSCPPADAFMEELVRDPEILALAFHVDYWDRLGWKDTFASKANTKRQYAYAKSLGNRLVWTPQFIVHGANFTRGNFRSMVSEYVAARRGKPAAAEITVRKSGSGHVATIAPLNRGIGRAQILVAAFKPRSEVAIKRGENAGRTLGYVNTVTRWEPLGRWNGSGSLEVTIDGAYRPPFAILVQADGPGEYIAAKVVN